MEKGIDEIQTLINKVIEFFVSYSFQVVGALIVLLAGFMIGKWFAKLVEKICLKKEMDITLSKFIASFVKIMVLTFTIIIALGKFGITIAPFIAALGAIAFGATYAIQGPLSNYGAGFSIILGRPFVVGDTITVAGVSGIVEEVKLANIVLSDEDGIRITIPNKQIVGEILCNSDASRIIEGTVGISYSDEPEKAIEVITKVIAENENAAKKPSPQIGIEKFNDSSIDIGFRCWVPTKKYFNSLYAVNLEIYNSLKEAHITIPFPQHDVYLKSETKLT